ncbi:class I histocompatibility antigen, Gogo-B*0101 alpha chain-like isoform X1 [Mus pahari]|uniref:class I histocompatibility antigen, Gogo-B*0101 alpha chain-like isoform X1 n=2 Tax=Mus pahari TaxID=10093 RepID=UPI000A312714|nr:class I histocompatibility antigen, Gogo-B*0101 alpha chain-like isoform X1 [Mus pahari]
MKTSVTEAIFLLLQVLLAMTTDPDGTHFFGFFQTLFTLPWLPQPHFISVGFVDDIQFERFNSRRDVQRTEHCAPWIDQKKPEYWKDNTDLVLSYFQNLTEILQRMLKIYNYSVTGYHTIQRRYGCYVLPRGYFRNGFFEVVFNDHDYIRLNEDLSTWTPVGKFAEILREEWDSSGFTQRVKTYLELTCVDLLLTELEYGKEILLRTDTPKIHVIRKVRPDKKITLRCWAMKFYPAEITLTWEKEESNHTPDMEVTETMPAGDGTFQKWAAVVVLSGEEHRYKCHVNHEGLPKSITMRWVPPEPISFMHIVIVVVLGTLLMGAMMTFLIWKRRTRGKKGSRT